MESTAELYKAERGSKGTGLAHAGTPYDSCSLRSVAVADIRDAAETLGTPDLGLGASTSPSGPEGVNTTGSHSGLESFDTPMLLKPLGKFGPSQASTVGGVFSPGQEPLAEGLGRNVVLDRSTVEPHADVGTVAREGLELGRDKEVVPLLNGGELVDKTTAPLLNEAEPVDKTAAPPFTGAEPFNKPPAPLLNGAEPVDKSPAPPLNGAEPFNKPSAPPLNGAGAGDGAFTIASAHTHPATASRPQKIILQRFTIYNSPQTMYVIGSNSRENLFRIMEISKANDTITILEDTNFFYTRKDVVELIAELNKVSGGIHRVGHGFGLLGLIRFTKGYYLSLVTRCSQVAIIGGHYIYHIDETQLIPLDLQVKPRKHSNEDRLLGIFRSLDLSKTFYFSYTYDITSTLQTICTREKARAWKEQTKYGGLDEPHGAGASPNEPLVKGAAVNDTLESLNDTQESLNDMLEPLNGPLESLGASSEPRGSSSALFGQTSERFTWNAHLLRPVFEASSSLHVHDWFRPIIHGFVDQANVSILGRKAYITLIARRSCRYAGVRFLKRGVSAHGDVANEVETEQIVCDQLHTSFHDSSHGFYGNPRITSFIQHRGSIPLLWTQDMTKIPKPPIEILRDPFHRRAALHFDNLFGRYAYPVLILNLVKTKEKTPRESRLSAEFTQCVAYLNQFLPRERALRYTCLDMSRVSKNNGDVITPLEAIAETSVHTTGFFHNGKRVQEGVNRTNCIDCLDRTNAAQFILGKNALGAQLHALGFLAEPHLPYDSDVVNILTEMFHDHGDTIALQYGGSHLVNTMDSYRKINQWSSHTRDYINSIKRIYSNSFMDSLRQEAIDLFLGVYGEGHEALRQGGERVSLVRWWTRRPPLKPVPLPAKPTAAEALEPDSPTGRLRPHPTPLRAYAGYVDLWWNETYAPRNFTPLADLFQFNMNSTARYFLTLLLDFSPFETRRPELVSPSKRNLYVITEGETPPAGGHRRGTSLYTILTAAKHTLGRVDLRPKPEPAPVAVEPEAPALPPEATSEARLAHFIRGRMERYFSGPLETIGSEPQPPAQSPPPPDGIPETFWVSVRDTEIYLEAVATRVVPIITTEEREVSLPEVSQRDLEMYAAQREPYVVHQNAHGQHP